MKKNKGFTIIELVIYIAISVIFLFGVTDFILAINSARQRGFIVGEVENQGAYMMDLITRSVKNSTGINYPSAGNSGQALSLIYADSQKNPTIYSLNSGVLSLTEGTSPSFKLHNNLVVIENLSFTNLALSGTKGSVKINFDVRYNINSSDPKMNYKRTFYGSASVR